jgi:hypothetical protein
VLVTPYLDKTPVEQTAVQREVFDRLFAQITSAPIDPCAGCERSPSRSPTGGSRSSARTVTNRSRWPTGRSRERWGDSGCRADAVGVYFNDATTGKMDTFLHVDLAASVRTCRADGAADVTVAVTLRSAAPAGARTFANR